MTKVDLLKGSTCSKVLILALVTIALVCPPDQCEATKCYTCEQVVGGKSYGNCDNDNSAIQECEGSYPCFYFNHTRRADGSVRIVKGCTAKISECFKDKLKFGLADGCKEASGPAVTECGTAYKDGDHLKYCVCSTDKCSGEGSFKGGSSGGVSSLGWNANAAGFIMTSTLIAAGYL